MGTYDRLADLSVTVDAVEHTTQTQATSSGFDRTTTTIHLHGAGVTGRGEDVTYEQAAHDTWATDPPLTAHLVGDWTIDTLSTALDDVTLFPHGGPPRPSAEKYRRWGIESAALDLALRQRDQSLGTVLDRSYDPIRFVVSTRLPDGDPTPVHQLLERIPATEFKLDASLEWTENVIADLAATDAVRVIDFKGQYPDDDLRVPADYDLYQRILTRFPDAIIEDPNISDAVEPLLTDHTDRLSWDAPISDVDTIQDRPWPPAWLNIKPSRFGQIEPLFAALDYARTHDIPCYGGGQFELDIGRTQLHDLAALFYPDAPNDIAPTPYNDDPLPSTLPTSPLTPPDGPGFGL